MRSYPVITIAGLLAVFPQAAHACFDMLGVAAEVAPYVAAIAVGGAVTAALLLRKTHPHHVLPLYSLFGLMLIAAGAVTAFEHYEEQRALEEVERCLSECADDVPCQNTCTSPRPVLGGC